MVVVVVVVELRNRPYLPVENNVFSLKKKKKKNPQQWDCWVSVHPWRIHVDIWQNQYNIVK